MVSAENFPVMNQSDLPEWLIKFLLIKILLLGSQELEIGMTSLTVTDLNEKEQYVSMYPRADVTNYYKINVFKQEFFSYSYKGWDLKSISRSIFSKDCKADPFYAFLFVTVVAG